MRSTLASISISVLSYARILICRIPVAASPPACCRLAVLYLPFCVVMRFPNTLAKRLPTMCKRRLPFRWSVKLQCLPVLSSACNSNDDKHARTRHGHQSSSATDNSL